MAEILVPLSGDDVTVLMLAANGERMMGIGRWEPTVQSLASRGLLEQDRSIADPASRKFNYVITAAGQAALQADEAQNDQALAGAINKYGAAQQQVKAMAEAAAQHLVAIAQASNAITGHAVEDAASHWSGVILERAKELLR